MVGTGSQLNILVFELAKITRSVAGDQVQVVAVHPLLTGPANIRYTDGSRSSVLESVGGGLDTRGGRALRGVLLSGTFGVAERGIGPFRGTGAQRFTRFYREIVRLGEAMNRRDVEAALRDLSATPGVREAAQSFDPDRDIFVVNLRDFWNQVHMQVQVNSFQWTRAGRSATSGRIEYTMQLGEVGPPVQNVVVGPALDLLMSFLSTWQTANGILQSTTALDQLDALGELGAVPVALAASTIEAVRDQVVDATALMGAGGRSETAFPSVTSAGTAGFFGSAQRLVDAAHDTVTTLNRFAPREHDRDRGRTSWYRQDDAVLDALANFDARVEVLELEAVGALQKAAGAFFGMSRDVYADWISSGGGDGLSSPEIGGSIEHVVVDYDTASSIEAAYGVPWSTILAVNGLTPTDALQPGATLQIPVLRAGGPQSIDGLPTFGSHVGQAAWGTDAELGLGYDEANKDLFLVSGPAVLEQGAVFLVEEASDSIINDLDTIPGPARTAFVAERFRGIFAADQRIAQVEEIVVVPGGSSLAVTSRLRAINGGSILAGGSR